MRSQNFNQETGQWEKTWGFNRDGRVDRKEKGMVQQDWLVEVDEKEKNKNSNDTKGREDKNSRRRPTKGPKDKKK